MTNSPTILEDTVTLRSLLILQSFDNVVVSQLCRLQCRLITSLIS